MLGIGLFFILISITIIVIVQIFFLTIFILNENSGAVTSILTLILVIITAYYAWVTHKILKADEKKRLRSIRPIIIANIKRFSFETAPDIASTDPCDNTRASFDFEICNFNSSALNISVKFTFPNKYDESVKNYDYVNFSIRSSHPTILEYKECWSGTEEIITYDAKWFSPPLSEIYLVFHITYEDIDQNIYSHKIFFAISYYYHSHYMNKVYEEIHMLAFEKRKMISDSFDPEKTIEVVKKNL